MSATRMLRTYERQSDRLHTIENRVIPSFPVAAFIFTIASIDCKIARGDDAVTVLFTYEQRQIGYDTVDRGVDDVPGFTRATIGFIVFRAE